MAHENMNIKDCIKQLESLKRDRLSFVVGDKEHDEVYLKDADAIEIVLGNLDTLCDMQRTADRELENARQINEEHRKQNAELICEIKELEEMNEIKKIGIIAKDREIKVLKEKVKELEEENKFILNSKIGVDLSYDNIYQNKK